MSGPCVIFSARAGRDLRRVDAPTQTRIVADIDQYPGTAIGTSSECRHERSFVSRPATGGSASTRQTIARLRLFYPASAQGLQMIVAATAPYTVIRLKNPSRTRA